jgi:hypothetical protein
MLHQAYILGQLIAWETSVLVIVGLGLLTLRLLHDKIMILANGFTIACHALLLTAWIM